MSILLESLNQSSRDHGEDVPGVNDSHFDDEMLSDEWLLKRLKIWKGIAAILLVSLLILGYALFSVLNQQADTQSSLLLFDDSSSVNSSNAKPQEKVSEPIVSTSSTENELAEQSNFSPESSIAASAGKKEVSVVKNAHVVKKEKYTPTKNTSAISAEKSGNEQVTIKSKVVKKQTSQSTTNSNQIINFEALSKEQQLEMPDLEISSYAVSSNEKKSFVVLNGAFYGQGEIIAPYLVLVRIEKESIVVRYRDQLIRKKYGS